MIRTILVFGQTGQVARELDKVGAPQGSQFAFAGRDRLDLASGGDPAALILEHSPAAVINAAAYTAVDRAESEPDLAYRLNRDAPGAMARVCRELDIPFVHFSTDYVFDGSKPAPYLEDDPIGPTGIYGLSKAEGEAQVLAAGGRAAILRTAWVFSAFGQNFVKTMLRLAATREEIGVVADQLGRPTWACDCAGGALRAMQALLDRETSSSGVFHLSGADDATWADFAEAIFERSAARSGPSARVRRITSAEYPTPAKRPANSRLDCGKIGRVLDWPVRPWREALDACFAELETVTA